MNILTSDFFEKDDKYVVKAIIMWVLIAFKYVFIAFRNKSDNYLFLQIINLGNSHLKFSFSVHNIHLYYFGQVENTKWILYS